MISTLSKQSYSEVENWHEFYRNGKSLDDMLYDPSWTIMFAHLKNNPNFKKINEKIKALLLTNKSLKIYPMPSYTFKAFAITKAEWVKVVFLGQDPYFKSHSYDGKNVPEAMGLSFSVADDIPIPSSLNNIFDNMIKYGHLKKKPNTGNLWYWAYQGCLMLNVALTVEHDSKKSHTTMWQWFTDYVIKYISDNMDDIIFVLWGSDAHAKINLIDLDKHEVIQTTHPSGLSAYNNQTSHPAFMEYDHFGRINEILRNSGRTEILWE
jgi:uracil-DNA glycosylase